MGSEPFRHISVTNANDALRALVESDILALVEQWMLYYSYSHRGYPALAREKAREKLTRDVVVRCEVHLMNTRCSSRMWSTSGFAATAAAISPPLLEAGPRTLELFVLFTYDIMFSLEPSRWGRGAPHAPLNVKKLKLCAFLYSD